MFQESIINENYEKINNIETVTNELLEIKKIPLSSLKIGEEYKTDLKSKCIIIYESKLGEKNNIIIKADYNILLFTK